jgi:Leucine-rich repeat (LRR) protein
MVSLTVLNLRENQISDLPIDVCDLKKLERLDLTNNGLLK